MRRWILDPIDGTEPFLAGERSWGTHVALEVDGEIVVAVITRPSERRRWWAVLEEGAWSGPDSEVMSRRTPVRVSSVSELGQARVGGFHPATSTVVRAVAGSTRWVEDPLGPVIALVDGRIDVVLASGGQVWDHAPRVLLVAEAGGRSTDLEGGRRPDRGGGTYTNGHLDHEVHDLLPRWTT